jgi:hypothetical protein
LRLNMRFLSPVTHAEAVWVLVNEFRFRVVRVEGLQTEWRRGASIPLYGRKGGTRTKLMISMHASGKKVENTMEQLVKKT